MITTKTKEKPHTSKKNKPNQETKTTTNPPQQPGNSILLSYAMDTECNYQTVSQGSELGTQHLRSGLNPAAYLSKEYF